MDDHFDIKSLPSNFVSVSHPSEIIDKLNEKRKVSHNVIIEEMRIKRKEMNMEIEEDILNISNNIKFKIQEIREDTDYFLYLILHLREHEFTNIEKNYFQNVSKQVLESNETRKTYVDKLYKSLLQIENKRTQNFKSILNKAYVKLLQISYQLPYELEEYFEKEMLKINQTTLTNHRHYTELQTILKLQIENDMKLWMQKLYEIKDKFKKHLKDTGVKCLEPSKIVIMKNRKSTLSTKSLTESIKMVLEFKLSQIKIQLSLKDINLWLNDVQMTMACFDKSAKYIVNVYKAAIVVIFHRFFKELEDIKITMLDMDLLNQEDIEPYECEIYTPTADELNLKTEEDFKTLQQIWGKLIDYIENSLNETYLFVRESTFLWDQHFVREDEAQKLVLEDVHNTVSKNILLEEAAESKLNYVLDKLRQSSTEQKLEKCLNEVKNSLEKIEELYRNHNIEEQRILDKYRDLIDTEINIHLTEIKRFLTLHPPDEEMDPKKQRKRASQESHINIDPTEELIPNQMLFCRFEVDALSNWMFGLWEAINHYFSCGRAEIMAATEEWIKFQSVKIKKRLDIQLTFCTIRFEKIRYSVYEKRLEELMRHSNRYKKHQMAVEMEMRTLMKSQESKETDYNNVLKSFSEEAEEIIKKILNTSKSYQARRFKEDLKVQIKKIMESMSSIYDCYNNSCDQVVENLKISKFKFKSSIRLFSENGNYDIEEAENVFKNLNKLDTSINKTIELIKKENRIMYAKYTTKLEEKILEASASTQEVINEHLHNEKTVEEMLNVQNKIQEQVMLSKTSIMKLKKLLKSLQEASVKKIGQIDFFCIFSNKFQEIVKDISRNGEYLKHPQPIVVYSSVSNSLSTTSAAKTELKDYSKCLFPSQPNADTEDTGFVFKLNNILYNALYKTQTEAKEFYAKRNILLDSKKIQPTYDKFMEEVFQKYKKFLIQSDICWLQIASDFVHYLTNFLNFKKEYLQAFETKFRNVTFENFKKLQNNIMKELISVRKDLENTYRCTHSKLKPLHGHPNNKQLLEELEREFDTLATESRNKLDAVLPPREEILTNEFQKVLGDYKNIKIGINCLSDNDNLSVLRTVLKEQFQTKLSLMKLMAGLVDDIESEISGDGKNEDIPLSTSEHILAYMKNIQAPPQIKVNFATSISSLSSESHKDLTPRDFEEELQEYFDKHMQNMTDFVKNELLQFHDEFQLAWSNDVKNIQNLYKIKYDIRSMSK